ncbi:MAG: phosphoribosylformylglycinamidine synthase, partial [Nitrosospira sp.]|nr:phosphoribosylformylglycinamidine synthase [Nitrosospira sp.]
MLRLRGGGALSPFRLEKLASALKIAAPQVSHIYVEYWYFCALERDLGQNEVAILENLLKSNAGEILPREAAGQQAERTGGELLLVLPRPGTISPWSSKATDIARHCGLEAVERLERGVAFYIQTGGGFSAEFPAGGRRALLAL